MDAADFIVNKFVKVDVDETVSKLIGKLERADSTFAVVYKDKKYVGVLSKEAMLRTRMSASQTKAKKFVVKAPFVEESTDVKELARLMVNSGLKTLPVFKNDKIIGVVHGRDLLELISNTSRKILSLATKNVLMHNEDDPLDKVIATMRLKRVSHIPILDEHKDLLGMVTIGDVMKKYLCQARRRPGGSNIRAPRSSTAKGSDILKLPVSNEIRHTPLTVDSKATVGDVAKIMVDYDISCVPVCDNSKPKGIVAIGDLLALVAAGR